MRSQDRMALQDAEDDLVRAMKAVAEIQDLDRRHRCMTAISHAIDRVRREQRKTERPEPTLDALD